MDKLALYVFGSV